MTQGAEHSFEGEEHSIMELEECIRIATCSSSLLHRTSNFLLTVSNLGIFPADRPCTATGLGGDTEEQKRDLESKGTG